VFKGHEFDRKEDKKVISVDEIGERYGKIAFAAWTMKLYQKEKR